jgi:hypothetical protein
MAPALPGGNAVRAPGQVGCRTGIGSVLPSWNAWCGTIPGTAHRWFRGLVRCTGGLGDLGHGVLPPAVQAALQPGTPSRPPRRRPCSPRPAAIRRSDRHRHPGIVKTAEGAFWSELVPDRGARAAIGWMSFPMTAGAPGCPGRPGSPRGRRSRPPRRTRSSPGQAEVGSDVVGAQYRQQRMSHAATCGNIFRALCHNSPGCYGYDSC